MSTGAYSEEAIYVPSVYNTKLNLVPLLIRFAEFYLWLSGPDRLNAGEQV
jgi:hypothetical protein